MEQLKVLQMLKFFMEPLKVVLWHREAPLFLRVCAENMVNTELLNTLLTIACQFLIEMSVTGKTTHILRMHRYFWLLKKPNDIKLIGMNEFKGTKLLNNPTKVTREKFVVFTGRPSYDLFDI